MCGALLSGLVYARAKNLCLTATAEAFDTSIIGGLCAYPIAILAGLVVKRFEKILIGGDNRA